MQSPIEFFVEINKNDTHFVGARRRHGRHDTEIVHKYIVSPPTASESPLMEPDNGRTGMSKLEVNQWLDSLRSADFKIRGPFEIEMP